MAIADQVNIGARVGEAATCCPPISAKPRSTTPASDASSVRPGRQTFIQNPIRTAMGMVHMMVKSPHGLSRSAFTTTSDSTAVRRSRDPYPRFGAARPGGDVMSYDPDKLYNLLPAIHRIRDAEQGEPLRELLALI